MTALHFWLFRDAHTGQFLHNGVPANITHAETQNLIRDILLLHQCSRYAHYLIGGLPELAEGARLEIVYAPLKRI